MDCELKSKYQMRLDYLLQARQVTWHWIREGPLPISELAIRLMYWADNPNLAAGRVNPPKVRAEWIAEASRLIRDIYLTQSRTPAEIQQVITRRKELAEERIRGEKTDHVEAGMDSGGCSQAQGEPNEGR